MTNTELVKYFQNLVKIDGVTGSALTAHIKTGVQLGVQDFWGAWPWTFAAVETTITTETGVQDYELPKNVEAVITVRQKETQAGGSLVYIGVEDFHRIAPYAENVQQGIPGALTMFYNGDTERHNIRLFQLPNSAFTLYVLYKRRAQNASLIPDKFNAGLVANCWKYLLPAGTAKYVTAYEVGNSEIERMKFRDRQVWQRHFTVVGEYDQTRTGGFLWDRNVPWVQ